MDSVFRMKTGTLLGYFTKKHEARSVCKKMQQRGYKRLAWISKGSDGQLEVWDSFPRQRIYVSLLAFLLGALLGFWIAFDFPALIPSWFSPPLAFFLAGIFGALITFLSVTRSRFGVSPKLIQEHSSVLVAGETILIVQLPVKKLGAAKAFLLENTEIPITIFVLHPKSEFLVKDAWSAGVVLTLVQLEEHAERLAMDHQLDLEPLADTKLLQQLEENYNWIHRICENLLEASRTEESVSPVAEWLLDNEYVLESNVRDVQLNLTKRYYQQFPALLSENYRGYPRIYGIAKELLSHTDLHLDQENILAFLKSYQHISPLSIAELWALPQTLRIVLVEALQHIALKASRELRERDEAAYWANRLIVVNRRAPAMLFLVLSELIKNNSNPSTYFASQLIDYLYDEGDILSSVQNWLERIFKKSLHEIKVHEKKRQAKDHVSIGKAFTSLRQLGLLDWKDCFEQLSVVEIILRKDPAEVYAAMDFTTRNRYRQAIEDLHRGSALSEEQVAKQVLRLAQQAADESEFKQQDTHVGYYLLGKGRKYLVKTISGREKKRFRFFQWIYRHHTSVYLLTISFFEVLFFGILFSFDFSPFSSSVSFLFALLLLLPLSQLSLDVTNYIIMRTFPFRVLSKMNFKLKGIPDEFRTLIVVPMMLVDKETIHAEVEKLEIRYLANKEKNLLFSLFSDYIDADVPHLSQDESLLQTAVACIEELNERHGAGHFFLFHRERTWCESEKKYMGWERKRGKLEELNSLLDGTRSSTASDLVYVGNGDHLSHIRFVITLDSDTSLPHNAARRMVETLAHPLNQVQFDESGAIADGYAVIQPRVSSSLPSATGSPFAKLFSDQVGVDPYSRAVFDVYQDLSGKGSYHGKGIYDVRAFSKVLRNRFPESWLLSHDLIEGEHVGVGLATDIELYDEFPQNYVQYSKRSHRWIRGDWQIVDWLKPKVPQFGGGKKKNQLSLFSRWKIFDNLRRSLLPLSNIVLLFVSWIHSPRAALFAAAIVFAQCTFSSLAQMFTWMTTRRALKGVSLSRFGHNLLRELIQFILLPYEAFLALDAIARVVYRRSISHRYLLEWSSAQQKQKSADNVFFHMMMPMLSLSGLSILAALALRYVQAFSHFSAYLVLLLWTSLPIVGCLLNRKQEQVSPQYLLSEQNSLFLRNIARRTWRYFSRFVQEETFWLPADNYQVSYQNQLAMRTSPTNIGLWMLSALSAYDFGYLTLDELVFKLMQTMKSINKLQRYEGHLLNWYDLNTLEPLNPRYVSTVDSGNFLASLWTLNEGLSQLKSKPLLDEKVFRGLCDTADVLQDAVLNADVSHWDGYGLQAMCKMWENPPYQKEKIISLLHLSSEQFEHFFEKHRAAVSEYEHVLYWMDQLKSQMKSALEIANSYFGWLAKGSQEHLGEESEVIFPDASSPSLQDIAQGNVAMMQELKLSAEAAKKEGNAWIYEVLEKISQAETKARQRLAEIEEIQEMISSVTKLTNMKFLYNTERRLFSIGYNVSEGRLDRAFYDLLASEARLGSFVAIARGDVPVEHWFAMNRPYGVISKHRTLLSWTGTMFEYLMPLLFQRSFPHSLLDKASKDAVAIQIAYGDKHKVPWGISESAFGDLDIHKTYQYHAFGVPELGLKRGIRNKIVVAPYATLLALQVAPEKAVKNLKRLLRRGLLSDYGYFEAMDFSRKSSREEGSMVGRMVRVYMAHHQGMGLLALNNVLHDNILQQRFHSDQRVKAFEPLLHECIPVKPPLHHITTRERIYSMPSPSDPAPAISQFDTADTAIPKTQLLSNGRYAMMVSNSGGGYSKYQEFDITRWRSDRTQDAWGSFCYLHDIDKKYLWSNTYNPVQTEPESYSANFTLDSAMFQRVDHDIETETELVVSPDDDVEIRRLTLTNHSLQSRRIDLTSYFELSLAPHNADVQHPAFNKMFVQTEYIEKHQALLAYRRLRSQHDAQICVAHRFTFDDAEMEKQSPLQFETDRHLFIGRGNSLASPLGAVGTLSNSQGFVLDPIFSLRRSLTFPPGRRVQVSMVMAANTSREHVLHLIEKYSNPQVVKRTIDYAWAASQLELRLLRIQADEARRFQQMASHLLFPNPLLRSSSERITKNRKGQSSLWKHAISGDLPIILLVIGDARDINLVKQLLQAHAYWQLHGLKADLVILSEEATAYEHPLFEKLEHLILSHSHDVSESKVGSIFLKRRDAMSEEDLVLLRAVANIVIVAARGTLHQQLSSSLKLADQATFVATKAEVRYPSSALPFMELISVNGFGGFTSDGSEYVVTLKENLETPAPWVNVIANPSFGTLVSETGSGFTWYGNSQRNRLTQWQNDALLNPASEAIYLRDEETGTYWTPTAAPVREEGEYRTRHGAGYSVFEHNSHGIAQELTVFVPLDDEAYDPIKVQRIVLRNESKRVRYLSLTYYVELTLGESRESSQMHVVTTWDDDTNALLARNYYNPDFPERVAFVALSDVFSSYEADRNLFIGRNRSLRNPLAMEKVSLSGKTGAGLDPCAALQLMITLEPGEQREIACLLGEAGSVEEAHRLLEDYRDDLSQEIALKKTKTWWSKRLNALSVTTPDPEINILMNHWLLYQTLSCRIWARSGFYQSGGAYGFRDQLQDVMAFLYTDPQLAREHILLAASRQFKKGDVQHWWHLPGGGGIRSRISDDLLWLPFVVAQYIQVTGDNDILHELVPFLDAPLLKDDQLEHFLVPEVSLERASLFEHCQRAVKCSKNFGANGLPLMGAGDWNDGMNLVGAAGKGESVWLAWFMVDIFLKMSAMAESVGQTKLSEQYEADRKTLLENIEASAWDGEWYRRAYFDNGSPLGSAKNQEAKIDSLSQSWASLSGSADAERVKTALNAVWEKLFQQDDGLVLLLDPPFNTSLPSPGYIQSYPPGVRENGGQYTHAAIWFAMALAKQGDGDRAVQVLNALNPIRKSQTTENAERYRVEPYVITADVYSLEGKKGMGGWSWYTGSASWMYRVWLENILGFKVNAETMSFAPVLPSSWDGFEMSYRHGEALYEIKVENKKHLHSGTVSVELDGKVMPDGIVPLERIFVKHHVIVRMG